MADSRVVSDARSLAYNAHTLVNTVQVDPDQAVSVVTTLTRSLRDLLREHDEALAKTGSP